MGNLEEALKKYDADSTTEEIIKGLQNEGYASGLNPNTQQQIFQNYLINLLTLKSNKELAKVSLELSKTLREFSKLSSKDIGRLQKVISSFSKSSSKAAGTLNFLTGVLAFATIALVIVTIVSIGG